MTHQEQTAFENIVGKGEIARNEQFLLFPQCFVLNQISVSPLVHIFDIIALIAVELEESKIGMSGKGLTIVCDNLAGGTDQDQTAPSVQSDLDLHCPQKQLNLVPALWCKMHWLKGDLDSNNFCYLSVSWILWVNPFPNKPWFLLVLVQVF